MEDVKDFEAQTQNAQFSATISVSQFSIAIEPYIYRKGNLGPILANEPSTITQVTWPSTAFLS